MKTKELTDKIILEMLVRRKKTLKKYGVKRIGLFGSFVRGEQKKNSDIDLIAEFDLTVFGKDFKGYFDSYMDLVSFLEKIFKKKMDVLTMESVSPYIRPYIIKEVKYIEI